MSDKKPLYVEGMHIKKPHSNAPDFVKFKVSCKRDEFKKSIGDFIKDHPDDEWINFDIKEAKSGKFYAEFDTWKPEKDSAPAAKADDAACKETPETAAAASTCDAAGAAADSNRR